MPTPHGSRGGMAFSAEELRVLRRALAHVLHASPTPAPLGRPDAGSARAAWAEDVQDVLRLAEAIDEAAAEAGRMRAFALTELTRYRAALPGTAGGYLQRLEEAVADGYVPDSDDLSALRLLTGLPCAEVEHGRRLRLRERCAEVAEAAVRRRLDAPAPPPRIASVVSGGKVADFARARQRDRAMAPAIPHRRGGTMSNQPAPAPREPEHEGDRPVRPVPTPGDLWPRGVRPKPPTVPDHPDEPEERPTGTG